METPKDPAYFPAKSPVSAPSPVSDASYSQKLKSSPEFQRFQVDFTLRSQALKNCFDAYLSDGGTVNKEELLSKTISLVNPKQTTLDVFDMLHNMRQVNDSTYAHSLNAVSYTHLDVYKRQTLDPGSIVTDTRANIHYLVTEYGKVNLKGLSTWQKCEAIISVAHPDFRDELIADAEKMHIWRRSNK